MSEPRGIGADRPLKTEPTEKHKVVVERPIEGDDYREGVPGTSVTATDEQLVQIPELWRRLSKMENSVGLLEMRQQPSTDNSDLVNAVVQLQGQIPNIERALVEQRQGIVNLDVRLTGLQQQIPVHNLGIIALQEAIKARSTAASPALTGRSAGDLANDAMAFFKFLAESVPKEMQAIAKRAMPNGPDSEAEAVN